MRAWYRRIKSNWNRTDTIVLATNVASFFVFIGNTWWGSAWVCTLASLIPIAIQMSHAFRVYDSLRPALIFGACIGAAWPIGEGFVTSAVGWWGEYLAPGPVVWHTPIYCMLIGWLASTHIYYVTQRTREMGWSLRVNFANTIITAALLGVVGENLFVSAKMWIYHPSDLDWVSVPAFVPVAYGIGYSVLPFIKSWRPTRAAFLVAGALLIVSVGLGFAVGFFPRHVTGQ
ncbi:MAG: hypothetical protein IT366_03505 [Candidatus Hydrogenedentes bacterium]|nr:hypothetical protein [Candidatus Hydrogenedentota bacterium]